MRRLAALFTLLALAAPASAGNVSLSPVTLTLPAAQRSVSVTVTNGGEAPTSFEVQVLAWTQNGEEQLRPADGLIAAPARFTLAPGAQQVVRVARLGAPPTTQRAYRVQILQLPSGQGNVQFTLRHLLPLFDGPPGVARLEARASAGTVTLRNAGSGVIRLANLEVQVGGTWQPVGLRYVLPGGTLTVATSGDGAARTLRYLDADGKPVTLPVSP